MEIKSIMIVGNYISHVVGSKIELVKDMGYRAEAIDTDMNPNMEKIYRPDNYFGYSPFEEKSREGRSILTRGLRAARMLGYIGEEPHLVDFVKQILKHCQPDILWGVWGTIALKWLRIFRRAGYCGKIIWTANVLPESIDKETVFRQSFELKCYKRWLPEFDGLILTDERMLYFLHKYVPKSKQLKHLIMPDYFPKSWFAQDQTKNTKNGKKNVIYLGAPERYVGKIDAVDSLLLELATTGINVHCAKPKGITINHANLKFYKKYDDISFLNGEFANFMADLDAAIVMYSHRGNYPRFESTFPTRFLMALCGRIPIFVKKGLLLTCEGFVEKHNIGKCYSTAEELKAYLSDKELMAQLKINAKKNYRFASDTDNNIKILKNFFVEL